MSDATSIHEGTSLYFHSPCFDGIVSCLLAWEFLEQNQGWTVERLLPVNYDLKEQWLGKKLDGPAAVVDFPYHPSAVFWADHHPTAFLTPQAEHNFRGRNNAFLLYDSRADSCSALLWKRLANFFGGRKPDYAELVEWSAKIDSARYASVEEAIFGSHPALQISASLAGSEVDYPEKLVRQLREYSMAEVAASPDVQTRASKTRSLLLAGLGRFSQSAHMTDDQIVVFDVHSDGVLVSRYAPFYEPRFRDARYSVGISRGTKVVITAMRNPWREFQSVPLGRIFASIGGGGHERVGSYIVPSEHAPEAGRIVEQVLRSIRNWEHTQQDDAQPLETPNKVQIGTQ
jgi:hypothetical protein